MAKFDLCHQVVILKIDPRCCVIILFFSVFAPDANSGPGHKREGGKDHIGIVRSPFLPIANEKEQRCNTKTTRAV